MIQRIQSLYLLASALILGCSTVTPFMVYSQPNADIVLNAFKIIDEKEIIFSESTPILTLGVSILLTALVSFVGIFLFKKRLLQLRIIRYTFILKIAIIGIVGYFSYLFLDYNSNLNVKPGLGLILLVISIITDWMAYKAIKKDDDLIRSIDRIR